MHGDDRVVEKYQKAQESLVLQTVDLSLSSISDMVRGGAIDIAPSYQRRERWAPEKQSALIESFLLNIPIPPVYLSEDEYGLYSVIDGKQRITAIHSFLTGILTLRGLEELPELNGRTFQKIPIALQRALSVRPYLRAITLLKQSDPDLKYEVFTRLNTGGERLEAQELRNVAFRGPLNDLIYDLAGNRFLRQQLKITSEKSAAYTSMLDAEYVLRFFTLADNWTNFSGGLRNSMDHFMFRWTRAGINESAMRRDFERSIEACELIWGEHAFHRPLGGESWRDQTLAGMYDAQMVAIHRLNDNQLAKALQDSRRINASFRAEFLHNPEFEKSIRVATNTPSSVRYRVTRMGEILLGQGVE
jgi:hypothetical protein